MEKRHLTIDGEEFAGGVTTGGERESATRERMKVKGSTISSHIGGNKNREGNESKMRGEMGGNIINFGIFNIY